MTGFEFEDEMTLEMIVALAQALIALAALIASIAIPVVLHRGQRRQEALEYTRAVRDMWIAIDAAVLQDDRMLALADDFLDPDSREQSEDERRKKWIALMILNVIYMDYLGATHGVGGGRLMATVEAFLSTMVREDDFFALTQRPSGYDDDFRALCREKRSSVVDEGSATKPANR